MELYSMYPFDFIYSYLVFCIKPNVKVEENYVQSNAHNQ